MLQTIHDGGALILRDFAVDLAPRTGRHRGKTTRTMMSRVTTPFVRK
jgi:hypothetical protein